MKALWIGGALLVALHTPANADPSRDLYYGLNDSNIEQVTAALAAGADPNEPVTGKPPLQRACMAFYSRDRGEFAKALLHAGANPNGRDIVGLTALHISGGRMDCVPLLLAAGADPNARTTEDACPVHGRPVLEKILGELNGQTGLEGLKTLLSAGARPNVPGCDGGSMHWQAARNFMNKANEYLQGYSSPIDGWWKPYVEAWQILDQAILADADAQDLMAQALAVATAVEKEVR
ncbi:ankyrin repeat domain-containing protein [Thalassospira xiamenensis]|uniref:Ankyrin repeat-containing protein n=1 Tax=Thalassospira xiamenensis TaxID=220697 RepID=A0A285TY80_9PROT|nr:ankyrin repeat domain-containing protein [Thalassospira xiamenensis]SOC31292.1 Ankyrin repeat-containing protein [Thalassospira xiamenensis]SOC31361.1 Ankyrin repeat-containing protein [Thalassospira xiamenensis]